MKYKKIILSALLFLFIGITGLQAQTLFIKQTNGTQTSYNLSNIKKINFPSGNIMLSNTFGITDTYPLSGISYINFQDLTIGIVKQKKQEIALQLFPNPVFDILNIRESHILNLLYAVEILSVEGKVVYKEILNQPSNYYQINVSKLSKGIYLCKINYGIKTVITKFFKN